MFRDPSLLLPLHTILLLSVSHVSLCPLNIPAVLTLIHSHRFFAFVTTHEWKMDQYSTVLILAAAAKVSLVTLLVECNNNNKNVSSSGAQSLVVQPPFYPRLLSVAAKQSAATFSSQCQHCTSRFVQHVCPRHSQGSVVLEPKQRSFDVLRRGR